MMGVGTMLVRMLKPRMSVTVRVPVPAFPGSVVMRVMCVMAVEMVVFQRSMRVRVDMLFAEQQRGGRTGKREREAEPQVRNFPQP